MQHAEAGEAVILQARDRGSATLLLPQGRSWVFLEADAARPVDFDLHQASADMAEAVIAAEREVREAGLVFSVAPRGPAVRPLPPDAGPERHGLLVRAVRRRRLADWALHTAVLLVWGYAGVCALWGRNTVTVIYQKDLSTHRSCSGS